MSAQVQPAPISSAPGSSAPGLSASGSSTPKTPLGVKDPLLKEAFIKILDTLKQLDLNRNSPKFFVLYAHESDDPSRAGDAQAHIVGDYVRWFQRLFMDVNSDRSPHGYRPEHASQHAGASVDIFNNQLCLLPTSWHRHNVDYVLVFYSKLLAEYMKAEREFKHGGQIYSEALSSVCEQYENFDTVPWEKACDEIRASQQKFEREMGPDRFHHVLTETGLVNFRNQCKGSSDGLFTMPVLLFGHESWGNSLKWDPSFLSSKSTQIRLGFRPEDSGYWHFLNILSKFETLQPQYHLLEAMKGCLVELTTMLKNDRWERDAYLKEVAVQIQKSLQGIADPGQFLRGRPVTLTNIRDVLMLHSKNASVKRLVGDTLVTDLQDIELTLIDDSNEGGAPSRATLSIPSFFEERRVESSTRGQPARTTTPKRILIQGKPGVGKTTLSKCIMYEYCLNEDLRDRFKVVVRLPLSHFNRGKPLAKILFDEYFKSDSRGDEMSTALATALLGQETPQQQNDTHKPLIILDGLDEAPSTQQTGALLKHLIKRNCVVITSRSHADSVLGEPMDLKLEAVGLAESGIDAYLENTDFVPSTTCDGIRRLCDSQPPIKDLMKIPIYLDILCYSWGELEALTGETDDAEAQSDTLKITSLYQAVLNSLWRKDVPKLQKTDHGQLVTPEVIASLRDASRLERLLDAEIILLEELAITMMVTEMHEISDIDIAKVIGHYESSGQSLSLAVEKNIQELSLLHSNLRDGRRYYQFFHLTFQEYFAARYLVRNHADLLAYLQHHKYNPRFEAIWNFVAGLYPDPEDFMEMLDLEPRDVIGTQHIYLIMNTLNECKHRLPENHRESLEQRLDDWLAVECETHWYLWDPVIASHGAFPETLLKKRVEMLSNRPTETIFKEAAEPERYRKMGRILFEAIRRRSFVSNSLCRLTIDFAAKYDFLIDKTISSGFKAKMTPDSVSFALEKPGGLHVLEEQKKITNEAFDRFVSAIVSHPGREAMYRLGFLQGGIEKLIDWSKSTQGALQSFSEEALSIHWQHGQFRALVDHQITRFEEALQALDQSRSKETLLLDSNFRDRFKVCAEAISTLSTKLLQLWHGPSAMATEIISEVAFLTLEHHPVPNSIIDKLGQLLDQFLTEQNSDPTNYKPKKFSVKTLALKQSKLPSRLLPILARLLRDPVPDVRTDVARKLQEADLPSEIVDQLRNLFDNGGDKKSIAVVLQSRLQLVPDALDWLVDQIVIGKTATIPFHEAVDLLVGQMELPPRLLTSVLSKIPQLVKLGSIRLPQVLSLFGDRRAPVDGFCDRLPELFRIVGTQKSKLWSCVKTGTPSEYLEARTALFRQNWFRQEVVKVLLVADTEWMLENIECALSASTSVKDPEPFDGGSIKILVSLSSMRIEGAMSRFEVRKSILAHNILCSEPDLDASTIKDLDRITYHLKDRYGLFNGNAWARRDINQFCTNTPSLSSQDMVALIYAKLNSRSERSFKTAYILGECLFCYDVDGTVCKYKLADETTFRSDLRTAQKEEGLPEWAWAREIDGEAVAPFSPTDKIGGKLWQRVILESH